MTLTASSTPGGRSSVEPPHTSANVFTDRPYLMSYAEYQPTYKFQVEKRTTQSNCRVYAGMV